MPVLKNAKLITRLTGCDAVKIESNSKNFNIIKKLALKKIPVMGHIGFTPQFKKKFKVEGGTKVEIKNDTVSFFLLVSCKIVFI